MYWLPGDYNADRLAATQDYQAWRATSGADVFMGSAADCNGSGVVDAADYVVWRRNQGRSAPQAANRAFA
jgi:hypothetical protein